jgi:hypothetical protein
MIEFLLAGVPLLLLILAILQLSLLWAGKSAVDTAAHLAGRKFARIAREDFRKAREMALMEALLVCRNRPGGTFGSAAMTALDVTRDGDQGANRASAGEALCIRLTHGVELVVPWVDRILYALSPGKKTHFGNHYYLMLQSSRWVTVE